MNNKLKLTVNTYHDTDLIQSSWPIWKEEPERVAVQFKGKEYMIVLDEKNPFFEVWSLDADGELSELEQTLSVNGNEIENFVKG